MRRHRILRNAKNSNAQFLELLILLAEILTFGSAAWSIVLWIKKQNSEFGFFNWDCNSHALGIGKNKGICQITD